MKLRIASVVACLVFGSLASHAEDLEPACKEIVVYKMTAFAQEKLGESIHSWSIEKVKKSSHKSQLTGKSKGKVTMRLNGKKFTAMVHDDGGHCYVEDMKMKS